MLVRVLAQFYFLFFRIKTKAIKFCSTTFFLMYYEKLHFGGFISPCEIKISCCLLRCSVQRSSLYGLYCSIVSLLTAHNNNDGTEPVECKLGVANA